MIYKKKHFIYLLIVIISSLGNIAGNDNKIPYLKALDAASIKVDSLNDILNGALIIGNGDINDLFILTAIQL